MRIVEEHEHRSTDRGRKTVTTLPHDQEDHWDSHGPLERRNRAEGDIGNVIVDIRVPNVLKLEMPVISHEPPDQSNEELSERGVDVKEVGSLKVLRTSAGALRKWVINRNVRRKRTIVYVSTAP